MRTLVRGRIRGMSSATGGVLIEGGIVTWVGEGPPPEHPDEEIVADPGELIAPGFIDLQVNGYGGYDAATGPAAITAISAALPATGVTAFLPTLISAPVHEGAAFVAATEAAAYSAPGARVLGAHLEGPFLNPAFRGAHVAAFLTNATAENEEVIVTARPRLVTIAPEVPGALAAIARFHREGIVVGAGHTGADFELGRRAITAGVRFATHIYNAMPPVHHRHPSIALALVLDPRVTVGLIADGEHVHRAVCEQLVRSKASSRIALTSDQTSAAGMPPGTYQLSSRQVISDGLIVRLKDGTLAGSAATMDSLVARMAELPGMTVSRAIGMASTVPARLLGEHGLGRIGVGACADLVILDANLKVRLTIVQGLIKFRR